VPTFTRPAPAQIVVDKAAPKAEPKPAAEAPTSETLAGL
jgi:hypothetical protein